MLTTHKHRSKKVLAALAALLLATSLGAGVASAGNVHFTVVDHHDVDDAMLLDESHSQ